MQAMMIRKILNVDLLDVLIFYFPVVANGKACFTVTMCTIWK